MVAFNWMMVRALAALQAAGFIAITCMGCAGEVEDTESEYNATDGEGAYEAEISPTAELPPSNLCGAIMYWYPSPVSETDSTGTQLNGTINTSIKVEVRESGTGLEARVCKPGGTFSNDVAFSIYDGASSNAYRAVSTLATAGKTCSSWIGLLNDTGYFNGQFFGGIWQVVSPASSASNWGFPYDNCTVSGSPGGTCWNGTSITTMRTCK